MINENFINFDFEPNYMDHDDTYSHKHHHTPAKLASHEYQKCMHKKKNEKECRANSLRVYENNISAEQKYINCMDEAKTSLDKRKCDNTFNKDNTYSYTSAYGAYEQAQLQYCMKDELKKIIKSSCGDCEKKSKNTESSIGEDMYYNSCIKNKEKCEKKYDNAKKCIDNLKTGEPETQECLDDTRFNSLYGPCYEHEATDIGGFIGKILKYLIKPIKKGIFYFIYFGFTVMTFVFFGGLLCAFLWALFRFLYGLPFMRNAKWAFPGIVIYEFINEYFKYVHPIFLIVSLGIWAVLFGICIMLYFFHKFFGKWPAIWVWKAIGLFPGNEKQVFNWFDRMFGCMKKSGRKALYCHNNNMWILIEDWMVEFAETVLEIDKTPLEIRNAINAIRDLGDDEIKVVYSMEKMAEEAKNKSVNKGKNITNEQTDNIKEEFTLFNNNKNNYIEENFILDNGFDMKKLDKLGGEFKNFKGVVSDVKKSTSEDYKKQGEDGDAFKNEQEARNAEQEKQDK
mgnify:CR=1 FL=1|jgi:hypothetical protein